MLIGFRYIMCAACLHGNSAWCLTRRGVSKVAQGCTRPQTMSTTNVGCDLELSLDRAQFRCSGKPVSLRSKPWHLAVEPLQLAVRDQYSDSTDSIIAMAVLKARKLDDELLAST